MDTTTNLKQDLSMQLQQELNGRLASTEKVLVSLPGSFGEALAASDRRVFVIRERDSGLSSVCDVFTYVLGKVTGASAVASGTGGYIEISLAEAPANADEARVYFPAYDLAKFQAAADYVAKLAGAAAAQAQVAVTSASPGAPAVSGDQVCSQCGAAAGADDVYCSSCGYQVKAICWTCGGSSRAGSEFCTRCGIELVEFVPKCPKCGSHITPWMEYCSECGSGLANKCAVCGGRIMPDVKHCVYCGRLLGSGALDASAAGRARSRLREWSERQRGPSAEAADAPPAAPESPAQSAPTPAERHNARGRELFDAEQTDEAIAEFEEAVKLDPSNPTYHCNLAVAYDDAERDEQALAEYQKTLAIDPDDLTALLSLGYMYNENEETDKAQQVWGRVLEIAPDSPEAHEVQDNLRHQQQL